MELKRASLASRTTLGVGGDALVAECKTIGDLQTALAHAREGGLRYWLLGEGSNTLADDAGFAGVVIRPAMRAASFEDDDKSKGTLLVAEAGAHWDDLVDAAAARGLWGIENLAGIPGSAGAAAVQNIGAYGAEFKDSVRWVECVDGDAFARSDAGTVTNGNAVRRFSRGECGFAYRDSRFKREKNLIVTRIALALSEEGSVNDSYPDFAKARAGAYGKGNARLDTPAQAASAVRAIRAGKFPPMRWDGASWAFPDGGTAGSFFKNPVIRADAFRALRARYPEMPGFPTADGVKVPLAFILDHILGLKGYRIGAARLYENQPLVLVADRNAHARDIDALANEVAKKVFDAAGVAIEREVVTLA